MPVRRAVVGTAVAGLALVLGTAPAAAAPTDAVLRPARAAVLATAAAPTPADSAPEPATGAASTPHTRPTTTLTVELADDGAATITVTVTAERGRPRGVVTVRDGDRPLAELPVSGAPVTLTTTALAEGRHTVTVEFDGAPPFADSRSAPVVVSSDGPPQAGGSFTVAVTIPSGALSITTPYGPSRPLVLPMARLDRGSAGYSTSAPLDDIVITDTRPGDRGFSASIQVGDFVNPRGRSFSGSHAGLTGLRATQVPGNAMRAADVRLSDTAPNRPGLAVPRVFATYPSGLSIGTVRVAGTLRVAGIPTSTSAGVHVARVTLTAI